MTQPIQRSLFEDGFLMRSLGEIAYRPEVAISELVANAWDAGAVSVTVTIPDSLGAEIIVEDDGVGLTRSQFIERWMRLGYKRSVHQGEWAEFPKERANMKRRAYGRNGQGRHGMLCFADRYTVETLRDGEHKANRFTVEPSGEDSPFILIAQDKGTLAMHGVRVTALVARNLPSVESIMDSLALTFLSHPDFRVTVNKTPITFEDFEISDETPIPIPNGSATVTFRKVPAAKRAKGKCGVAFFVGRRLVGQPDYGLFGVPLIDGRSNVAKNHLIVVQSEDLYEEVKPDWSGFKRTDLISEVSHLISDHVKTVVSKLNEPAIQDTKNEAYKINRDGIGTLTLLGKVEITEFVDNLVTEFPTLNVDVLSAALRAAVNLEKSRSGKELLLKLATIAESDVELLTQLLSDWTLRDALAVLDEISRRLSTVEAIKRLKGDKAADELHTLHPLVAHARWLFGVEYDSPSYLSNTTIKAAAERVFKKKIDVSQICNPRQRPDLLFVKDATFGITGVDRIDNDNGMPVLGQVLLIELKRGDTQIILKHVQQAETYVQDLLNCGLLDGSPFIHAFVVGHRVDPKLQTRYTQGAPEIARIHPVTFDQLVRKAELHLFHLNKRIAGHFADIPALKLVQKTLGEEALPSLFADEDIRPPPTNART